MPNWCFDNVTFFTNANNINQLHELHRLLLTCTTETNKWLGKALIDGDIISEEAITGRSVEGNMRSFLVYLGKSEDHSFDLQCQSAWEPAFAIYDLLATHFNLEYVLQADEPGLGIYINTDTKGTYYDTRYILKRENYDDEYFPTMDAAIQWINNTYNLSMRSEEQLHAYLEEREYEICMFHASL